MNRTFIPNETTYTEIKNVAAIVKDLKSIYCLYPKKQYPKQQLRKQCPYRAIKLTKVSQTQPQMVLLVLYDRGEKASIVELVISPSDHIRVRRTERKPKLSCQAITPLGHTKTNYKC